VLKMTYNLMNNTRAQEDSTLVWIFSIFVILFILVVYIGVAFSMTLDKSFNWKADVKTQDVSADNAIYQNLFLILNSKIEFNGKQEKIIDVVYATSLEYLEIKEKQGFDSRKMQDFQEKNKQLILAIQNNGKQVCSGFYVLFPFGFLSEKEFLEDREGVGNEFLLNVRGESDYSPVISYSTKYNGKDIKIKYRQKNICSGSELKG